MSNLFDRVGIDLGVIVLLLIVLVIVLAIMTVSMSLRLTRLNQKYKSFMKGREGQSLEKLFSARFKEIVKGESYIMLSDEEIDALRQAVSMDDTLDLLEEI